MKRGTSQVTNYGIYGNTNAEVLAVGPNSTAQKTVIGADAEHLLQAIDELRRTLLHQDIPTPARKHIEKELGALDGEAKRAKPRKKQVASSLNRLRSVLKTVGGIASDGAKIIAPIKRIAEAAGIALSAIGLT